MTIELSPQGIVMVVMMWIGCAAGLLTVIAILATVVWWAIETILAKAKALELFTRWVWERGRTRGK